MKYRARLITLVSAVAGTALFIYVIARAGPAQVIDNVSRTGAGFLLILLISFLRFVARSIAWRRCIPPDQTGVSLAALLRARIAGEAIGDLTFGPMVAEPMRIVALGDHVPLKSGISSLAVEHITYAVSSALMVAAGLSLLIAGFGFEFHRKSVLAVPLTLVLALTAVAVILIARRVKIASIAASRLLPAAWKQRLAGKIAHLSDLEDYILDFFSTRPRDFFLVMASQTAFHAAGVAEIWLTLRLIGAATGLTEAFILETANRTINILFTFVPGLVGVDEAGSGLAAASLGIGAATGVSLAVIRKLRMFFWIAAGLALLLAAREGKSKTP